MAGASDVKRRIKSVENTRQITKTMELVATSKLKKATERVRSARPYADSLAQIVSSLYAPELSDRFPLLRSPEHPNRVAVLLLTANRGLAGGFNTNLIKEARVLLENFDSKGIETDLHIVGKKGIAYFRFRGRKIASSNVDIDDSPSLDDAESIISGIRDDFASGHVDAVYVVSSEFRSVLSTPPSVLELLPIRSKSESSSFDNYLFSPKVDILIQWILPVYLRNTIYRALVENVASEQGARRTAMKSATDNASDVLEYLTRTYNRVRQAQITQEIAEIVGGAAALE